MAVVSFSKLEFQVSSLFDLLFCQKLFLLMTCYFKNWKMFSTINKAISYNL